MKRKHIANHTFGLFASLLLLSGCAGGSTKPQINQAQVGGIDVVGGAAESSLANYNINVYLENSASMDGYVKSVTRFEQAIYSYLKDVETSDVADSIKLYYINSKPILFGDNITEFIERLEPSSFKQRGGKRGSTDISNLLETVLGVSNNQNVSILISDFILSPGGKDAEPYLVKMQIEARGTVANFLKTNPDHGVIVYHLESQFDGLFYDKFDHPIKYKGDRPYYIWIIGNRKHLKEITTKCPAAKFMGGGVQNVLSLVRQGCVVEYAIKQNSGDFKPSRKDPKHSITDAKRSTKGVNAGKLTFDINVDFSNLLCSDEYLANLDNYISNNPDYKIDAVTKNIDGQYTHTLSISTAIVRPSTLNISVKSTMPEWVYGLSDDDGVGIDDNNRNKTFGLKYLLGGLYEGFVLNGDSLATLSININN